jgi:hypothetical protein
MCLPEPSLDGKADVRKEDTVNQLSKLRYATRGHSIGFAKRTEQNLRFIQQARQEGKKGVHVVTQIVNSMLGLVVFPWERGFVRGLKQQPVADLTSQGWPEWHVTVGAVESQHLGEVLLHLRNGTAHGHIEFSSDSPDPKEVTITVRDRDVWCGDIRADHLQDFCYRFIDLVDTKLG